MSNFAILIVELLGAKISIFSIGRLGRIRSLLCHTWSNWNFNITKIATVHYA